MDTALSRDGTSIVYDRVGSGPAVILVDGAFCSRAFGPMPKLAPLLASDFTVISYDRRGRGDSGDTQPDAVEREIEDLDALIRAAGGAAHVLGISSGAVLALKAAARGLGIMNLALYEPPFVAVSEAGHRAPPDSVAQLTRMIATGRRGEAVKFYLTQVMGAPRILYYGMRIMPLWRKMKAVAPSLPYDAAIMGDFVPPQEQLASVSVPTLVIGGAKSPAALRAAVQATADAVPGARRRMLKGQTHNVAVHTLAPVLTEFFTTHTRSTEEKPRWQPA